tara:strand:+ start:11240 stop:11770 length:531 start_codon:yes stop_codon:yes gene_type:complete
MNTILQDILGLFTRKKIITSKQLKDNDYLAVAEIKSKNIGTPSERDVRLIKASDLVPPPEEKLYDTPATVSSSITLNLNDSDYFFIDVQSVVQSGYGSDITINLLPSSETKFVGTKQIVIKNVVQWSGTWVWSNVKWPNGVDPVWSIGQNGKYDVVTITGHARGTTDYLGVASVNH